MVTNPDLDLKLSQIIYEEEMTETETLLGLDFVDFYFLPHLNNPGFRKMRKENIEKLSKTIERKIYALDDTSAIKIDEDTLEIISE